MNVPRVLGLMTVLSVLGWSLPSPASTQLLYVQEGHHLVTYRVDPQTAAATKLGSLYINSSPDFPVQLFSAGSYVYILGFTSATEEYFWVHSTTPEGVPNTNPVQKLAVKPLLTQFFFHPSGNFGYAMYSSLVAGRHCAASPDFAYYVSQVVLYTVNPKTGMLTNTQKPVASFPASCSDTTLYGLNSAGTRLYTDTYNDENDNNDNAFSYYNVNPANGLLSRPAPFFNFDSGVQAFATTVIGENSIAMWNNGSDSLAQGIYFYSSEPDSKFEFFCGSSMSQVCADSFNYPTPFQFDPSGKYLFINDNSLDSVIIAAVDLNEKRLTETGASFPSVDPSVVSFSPDGTLIYAVDNYNADNTQTVTIYVFDPSTGKLLTKGNAVDFPLSVGAILPAARP